MYGIFTYIYHKKINQMYLNIPYLDPMGHRIHECMVYLPTSSGAKNSEPSIVRTLAARALDCFLRIAAWIFSTPNGSMLAIPGPLNGTGIFYPHVPSLKLTAKAPEN